MAHEIDLTTGRAAAFYAGEPAWHRLGTVVKDARTSAEAINLAGLDWTVEQRAMAAAGPSGWIPVPNTLANVRSDTNAVLGVVSSYYRPFQNLEAFAFMDELVGEKLAMFETAGSLKGGKRVWMLARIPQTYHVGAADEIQPYVLLTNGHDGGAALRMIPTSVRVVCWNTLTLALSKSTASEGITIFHFGELADRVQRAREALGLAVKRFETFEADANRLAQRQLTAAELATYFANYLPAGDSKSSKTLRMKMLDSLLANFENERQNLPGIRGTAWAAYNAVSEYADHTKGTSGKGDNERLDNRVNSIWFGSANSLKQKAFEDALALAV
jgi:phage/plasmid-like protein (TIGR03299 family)